MPLELSMNTLVAECVCTALYKIEPFHAIYINERLWLGNYGKYRQPFVSNLCAALAGVDEARDTNTRVDKEVRAGGEEEERKGSQ